jgi:hypothetical protein
MINNAKATRVTTLHHLRSITSPPLPFWVVKTLSLSRIEFYHGLGPKSRKNRSISQNMAIKAMPPLHRARRSQLINFIAF